MANTTHRRPIEPGGAPSGTCSLPAEIGPLPRNTSCPTIKAISARSERHAHTAPHHRVKLLWRLGTHSRLARHHAYSRTRAAPTGPVRVNQPSRQGAWGAQVCSYTCPECAAAHGHRAAALRRACACHAKHRRVDDWCRLVVGAACTSAGARAVGRAPPRRPAAPRFQPRLPPPVASSMHPARALPGAVCVHARVHRVVHGPAACRTATPAHPHTRAALHARAACQPRACHASRWRCCMHHACRLQFVPPARRHRARACGVRMHTKHPDTGW